MFSTRSVLAQLITAPLLAFSAVGETGETVSATTAPEYATASVDAPKCRVYIGTYTSPTNGSKGIYLVDLDMRSGELTDRGLVAAEVRSPSFLAVHPSRRFLYAVSELNEFQGQKAGAVSAFAIDAQTGKLKLLNQQPSGGQGPCHVTVDPAGKCVLTANYTTGTVAALPIDNEGRLREPTSIIQHTGSGPNAKRQQSPHAHSINLDPVGRFAFAADLGADKVFIYRLAAKDESLVANDPPFAQVAPGSGPRHFTFHPTGRFAYVINELNSTITALSYDADRGVLKELQTVPTLPKDFAGRNFPADIHVHPTGRFLYGSNRGHDSIAVFTVDELTGRLTAVGHASTGGKNPRNFAIDPSGRWLLAANQDSNTIIVFRIDPRTGLLTARDGALAMPSPVCLRPVVRPR